MPSAPRSFSLTRGQADAGLGEGPDRPSLGGEQYLTAEGGLASEGPFLAAARPWMTLDAAPKDLGVLGNRLEGWSAVRLGNRWLVVRLVPAGAYDHRAAYFAHGRVWPAGGGPFGFDPGVWVGANEAFATSAGAPFPGLPDDPTERLAVLAGDPEEFAGLVAALFTASRTGRVLLISAPLAEFTAGSGLANRIAIARAALPVALKNELRLRIYTQDSASFLPHEVTVLALPEERARESWARIPGALLVSSRGQLLSGADPLVEAREYAAFVAERFGHEPAALLRFAARRSRPAARTSLDEDWELAAALAQGEPARLDRVLARVGQPAAVEAQEWAEVPDASLRTMLLSPCEVAMEEGLAAARQRGLQLEEELGRWWQGEPWQAGRLARLAPDVVGRQQAAQLTGEVTSVELGAETAAVLALERAAGRLSSRLSSGLAVHLLNEGPAVTRELVAAAEAGEVSDVVALLTICDRAEAAGQPLDLRRNLSTAGLAAALQEPGRPPRELIAELDRRLEQDPRVIVEIFHRGDGGLWRQETTADARTRRAAALAWLASNPKGEQRLEVWLQMVGDLEPGLTREEWTRLGLAGDGPIPGSIRLFEDLQRDRLRRLVPRWSPARGELLLDRVLEALRSAEVNPAAWADLAANCGEGGPWVGLLAQLKRQQPQWSLVEGQELERHGWRALCGAERLVAGLRGTLRCTPDLLELLAWIEPGTPIAELAFRLGAQGADWRAVVALAAASGVPSNDRRRWPEAELALLWSRRRDLGDPGPLERAFGALVRKGNRPMHDVVTLFLSRQVQHPGVFEVPVGGARAEVLTWPPLRESAQDPVSGSLSAVLKALEVGAGGLVLVRLAGAASVDLHLRPGSRYKPASQMVLVNPAGEVSWLSLRAQTVPLNPGHHLIVPVEPEAQALLRELVNGLTGLPRAKAAGVVQGLTSPSLEPRLWRLEQAASVRDLPSVSGGKGDRRGPRGLLGVEPRRLLVALLVLFALGLGGAVGGLVARWGEVEPDALWTGLALLQHRSLQEQRLLQEMKTQHAATSAAVEKLRAASEPKPPAPRVRTRSGAATPGQGGSRQP